jgi:deoxyribodipyrimidine photo-lyase
MNNIFIFHRDLRLYDNTALIKQSKLYTNITPIFIFTPEQIDKNINKYFSNNSVQFMIESLNELKKNINEYNGNLYFFNDNYISVLHKLHKLNKINSIAFNLDYTPYAIKRDNEIIEFAKTNNINIITTEDYTLYDIMNGQTKSNISHNPYMMFTPFKNHCIKNLIIKKPDKFNNFKFNIIKEYNIGIKNIDIFYDNNIFINVHGGRTNGLKILNKINKFKNYNELRNNLDYNTTFLSAYLHFCVVSPREVYHKILNKLGNKSLLINELHWRDFYMNITYYFPHVLQNKSFKKEYDNIKWINNKEHFDAWCNGETGFPIIDASMKQLNKTGFMHNRCRMITASFLVKDLHIDWKLGELYFATKLIDYSPMQNNGGWQWCASCGCDAQPYFRIFNPWLQSKKYDKECVYIKKWIPELINISNKYIHEWYKYYDDNYIKPIIIHSDEVKKTLEIYKLI